MNVLLLGSGGREHALAWSLSKSAQLTKLYASPGNAGIAQCADIVSLDMTDHAMIVRFCQENAIDLVIVGPEAPLVAGLVDDLEAANIRAFGPTKAASQLEGSKRFTKEICTRYNIPTAHYAVFDNSQEAIAHIEDHGAPIVVKADGLAAGKGVVVAESVDEAIRAVEACFSGTFGKAGEQVILEECLIGEEASFFALSDGKNILPLASAQDHKAVGDGDTGPNTGGMGAYSPAPVMSEAIEEDVLDKIIKPTIRAMADMGHPYKGVLFAGLMITKDGPKLIEHNCRFGDPECQVLLMRLKDDILTLLNAAVDGLLDHVSARWHERSALTVVLAAKGYPGSYNKGSVIEGLDVASGDDVKIFHAGTKREDDKILANGGRVLNVTALGDTITDAQTKAYEAISKLRWEDGFCRKDIGWRAVTRENKQEL